MHDLIRAWRQLDHSSGQRYVLPDDEPFISPKLVVHYPSLARYNRRDKSNDTANSHLFQIGLLPVPYLGQLETASVFILLNNPGFTSSDYETEIGRPSLRGYLLRNLRQSFGRDKYPFICLNPAFSEHAGYGYWEPTFRPLIQSVAAECSIPLVAATSFVAKQLACLQLVPYHSKDLSKAQGLPGRLPSTQMAVSYVHEDILPRAKSKEALVIVWRGHRFWGIPDNIRGILKNPAPRQQFSASLGSGSGQAIRKHLVTKWKEMQAPGR